MTRYTARNGTTFLMDGQSDASVAVAGAEQEGPTISVDLEDLREFVQYLEAGLDAAAPSDSDCAAIGPD